MGCEAFVRKFTRKTKKDREPEEMVLAPEEYKCKMSKEELYRQYFLFWKSWQDELINALQQNVSLKKKIDCADEALENLNYLRPFLNEAKQKKLDIYIGQLNDLRNMIASDLYGANSVRFYQRADRLKMNILRDFSFGKVSKDVS
jgi:hypothetical protein